MKADWLWDLFDRDKAWLARQPRLSPWDRGRDWLARQIIGWLVEYSTPLCDRPVTVDHADARRYSNRLWDCWSYHWQTATNDA